MEKAHEFTIPNYKGEVRVCVSCKCVDQPIFTHEYDADHQPIFWHKVTLDVVWLNPPRQRLERKELDNGWRYMRLQDRDAKIRFMCRECIQQCEDRDEVWRDMRREQIKAQEGESTSFWAQLCG